MIMKDNTTNNDDDDARPNRSNKRTIEHDNHISYTSRLPLVSLYVFAMSYNSKKTDHS